MALRALQGPTGGGTPVGGTGTTNTIPRWTGPSTLGDSIITQDANARAIGVATAANPWNAALRAIDLRTNSLWNYNSGNDANAYWTVNAYVDIAGNLVYKASAAASEYRQSSGQHIWYRAAAGVAGAGCALSESARIDSSGNFGLGTTPSASTLPTFQSPVLLLTGNTETDLQANAYYAGAWKYVGTGVSTRYAQSGGNHLFYTAVSGTAGNNISYTNIVNLTSTAIDASIVSGYGLKLPATPGNADTQTLDAYQENTWTATDGSGAGLTFTVNNTAVYTRVGRLVHVRVDIIFPATASAASALINLPFNAIAFGGSTAGFASGIGMVLLMQNGSGTEVYNTAGARLTNANLSAARVVFSAVYQAA